MNEVIRITTSSRHRTRPDNKDLGFGRVFSDHMFLLDYTTDRGWHDPRIEPYAPFSMEPAAAVLHYGQAVFEGLKAYRGVDEKVRLFRPRDHVARLERSMRRMCMPPIRAELALESLLALVEVDREWVPRGRGTALYIRPTVIATEAYLGLRPSETFTYFVILSPVGPYYAGELNPIKVVAFDKYSRSVPGGTGDIKTAGNYGGGLLAMEEAKKAGFDQVVWLDSLEHTYIDEIGNMNIMFRIGDEVVSPPLSDTILPGMTRDSALTLLREWGVRVVERRISIDEVADLSRSGRLREVWGTGTAGVICPIGEIVHRDRRIAINGNGELTTQLYDSLLAIQYGTVPDTHGWMVEIVSRRL